MEETLYFQQLPPLVAVVEAVVEVMAPVQDNQVSLVDLEAVVAQAQAELQEEQELHLQFKEITVD
jgi:hypothetical protein